MSYEDAKCPNCGALWASCGYDDRNEFGDIVLRCANCGYSVPQEE